MLDETDARLRARQARPQAVPRRGTREGALNKSSSTAPPPPPEHAVLLALEDEYEYPVGLNTGVSCLRAPVGHTTDYSIFLRPQIQILE